tara:strand:- start:525 stop:1136 length:612 start_codon:yes stop_codon:yes gene_type:complete
MQNLPEIENLIKLISKLPGLGPKSAKRIILKMINNRHEILKPLTNNLNDVFKNIERCKICGILKSNNDPCNNCENNNKKYSKVCVVENISDQWAIESSSVFQGSFHILGGTISDSNNSNNRENLLINSLIERINKDNIEEIILATSATVEGQTTAFYIQDSLKKINVKISKLALGLPVGGEIENSDDGTLISAFKNRKDLVNL